MGAPLTTAKGFALLAGAIKLAKNQKTTGTALAIFLSDDQRDTVWHVVVKAQTSEGEYIVGTLVTRAPMSGDPRARAIGLAYIPGVLGWSIDVYGSPSKRTGRFVLSTGPSVQNSIAGTSKEKEILDMIQACCPTSGGGTFGLVPLNGSRIDRRIWDPPISPIVPANQGILGPGPGIITNLYAVSDAAVTGFFGMVDKDSAVALGDPWRVGPIAIVVGTSNYTFPMPGGSLNPEGVPFQFQPRWAFSSTLGTVTLGAGLLQTVQAERI
jgi:hypothetical protein